MKKGRSKKRRAMGSRKRAAVSRAYVIGTPPPSGPPAAEAFFDEVENNAALQAMIGLNNQNIITLAKEMGFYFSYQEMTEHLAERWDIRNGPPEDYCCF
jgi:hypothetical protein